jgi:alpha-galactosidase
MTFPGTLSRRVRNKFAGRIAGAGLLGLLVSFTAGLNYTIWAMNPASASGSDNLPTAYALYLKEKIGHEGFPEPASWQEAPAVRFASDWRGSQSDPQRETEVRLLWNTETLFLRFLARYRELNVFPDARPDGWRDQLWDRDVAEAFLQPDDADPLVYKELEVSPNGFWIDLNISHGEKDAMRSGLRRRVTRDAEAQTWTAEIAVPMRSLTQAFHPEKSWRVNFYRVEGTKEPRFYAAWSPTMTSEPNFHVPAAFGKLEFRKSVE